MNSRKSLVARNHQGFTLVELMITLAMSAIIVAAIYSAYIIQQKTYYTQGQVVDMQQNIRAGLEMMVGEMRTATYDPDGKAGASITTATIASFGFTADLDGNGDVVGPNESVKYELKAVNASGLITSIDSFNNDTGAAGADGKVDTNGVNPATTVSLTRDTGGGPQTVAEGIQGLEFLYTLDDGLTTTSAPTSAQLSKIQTVQITLLAVSSQRDSKYTNTEPYISASGAFWPGPLATDRFNDSFRRRLLSTSVKIRNHGLN